MARGMNNQERKKFNKKLAAQERKRQKMKRGDLRQAELLANEPVAKIKHISAARQARDSLEHITRSELPNFIQGKTLYSNIYYKKDIAAQTLPFNYFGSQSWPGVELTYNTTDMKYHFGFTLLDNPVDARRLEIKAVALGDSGLPEVMETKHINPKRFCAKVLVGMIENYSSENNT